MNQVALASKHAFDAVRQIPANLAHPQAVGLGRNTVDLHFARRHSMKKSTRSVAVRAGSTPPRRRNRRPRSVPNAGSKTPSKSSSCSAPVPVRSRAAEECRQSCCVRVRAPGSTARPGSDEAPVAVVFGHADHQRLNLAGRARSARCTLSTTVVLLRNQFTMPSQQGFRRDDCGHLRQKLSS